MIDLEYVRNEAYKACVKATKESKDRKYIIQNVLNADEEFCLKMVSEDWKALEYVVNQTIEMCVAACSQDAKAIEFVNDEDNYLYCRLLCC